MSLADSTKHASGDSIIARPKPQTPPGTSLVERHLHLTPRRLVRLPGWFTMTSGSTPMEPNCRSERARSTVASAVQRSRLNSRTIKAEGTVLRGDLLQHSCAKPPAYSTVLSSVATLALLPDDSLRTKWPLSPSLAFSRRERDVTTRHRTPQNLAITIKTRTDGWRNIHTHWLRQAGSQLARFSRQGNSFAGQYPTHDAQRPEKIRWRDEEMPDV